MNSKKSPDIWLFTITIVLLVVGLLLVLDASYARAGQAQYTHGDSFFFAKRQAKFAVIGIVAMFLAMRIRYWKIRKYATGILIASICALLLVFIPGFGVNVNGATRWINIGPIQLQPSEIAKIGLIIYLAAVLSMRKQAICDWKRGLLPLALPVGITILLVVKEDMGTAIVLTMISLAMVFIAGIKSKHMLVILGGCVALAIVAVLVEPYRIARLTVFIDPFKDFQGNGYQVCQSLIALGSGGPLGVGLCEGREKLFYLPAEHTDFIFAVLGEEGGLIGTWLLALGFFAFAARGIKIAFRTKDLFGRLMAAGISVMIASQAFLNMSVVTSSLPATGVPLPFISYGGSSLAINLLCVGLLLGISRYPKPTESYEYEDNIDRRRNRRPRVSGNQYR